MLGRTTHSISYDPIHDEFTVPQQIGQAILTFRGGTNGEEPPIRVIQGPLTELRRPDRVEVDPLHNEIFVPEQDEILVYPREANGNVAPIRVLKGPKTRMDARALAVDPLHNLLVVGGARKGEGTRLWIFDRSAEGDVAPKAIIGGPKSGLLTLGGPFALYPPKEEIIATVREGNGELGVSEEMASDQCYVGIWSTRDNGDVPPRFVVGGPKGVLQMVRGVAVDAKHKSLIVSDKRLNAVMTFYFPEIF